MKIVLLLLAFSLVLILKNQRYQYFQKKSASNFLSRGLIDISELYTIKYQSHMEIFKDINNFTHQEQQIIDLIKSEELKRYNFYVVGGWVRDKVK